MYTCSMNLVTNCTGTEPTRPCTQGDMWYGRGAIQLTGQANYQAAQAAGFAGVGTTPDLVATNVDFAFGTAAWFWTTTQSAVGICHQAIVGGNFGQTTRIINGIECGGTLQDSRVTLYKQFCAALGINAGGTLRC
jgi:chitinase